MRERVRPGLRPRPLRPVVLAGVAGMKVRVHPTTCSAPWSQSLRLDRYLAMVPPVKDPEYFMLQLFPETDPRPGAGNGIRGPAGTLDLLDSAGVAWRVRLPSCAGNVPWFGQAARSGSDLAGSMGDPVVLQRNSRAILPDRLADR